MDIPSDEFRYNELLNHYKELEERVARIEMLLQVNVPSEKITSDNIPGTTITPKENTGDLLEYQIGQFWFAKIGIVVFIMGIVFLLTFPYHNLPTFIPTIMGYFIAAILMVTSLKLTDKFKYFAGYLNGGAISIFYFSTLRLYFFTHEPVITNSGVETFLLILIFLGSLAVSLKNNSLYLTGVSLTLGYLTALVNNSDYFIFTTVLLLSGFTVYLKIKYKWEGLLVYGIILTYLTHFLWFINNPIIGNEIKFIYSPQINSIFILIYLIIFSSGNIIRRREAKENYLEISGTALNLILGYGLFLAVTLGTTGFSFTLLHILVSFILISLAIIFWEKIQSKFSTFLFAMTGYLALSTAIINQFPSPEFYIWLCWQSILVVSTAIWFKSKFIIIANFFIYLLLFALYVSMEGQLNSVALSFGIVALLSARILNWKKERLELKTDRMRDGYLLTALVIIPYALYHSVPREIVSIAWVGVALLYYLLSKLLKSKKYRWMAIATFLMALVYIFIIAISDFELIYKIISFLFLGIVMLVISLLYAKTKTKYFSKNEQKT
jgi:Predicted membrane protein (DUF2339)